LHQGGINSFGGGFDASEKESRSKDIKRGRSLLAQVGLARKVDASPRRLSGRQQEREPLPTLSHAGPSPPSLLARLRPL